MEASPGPGAGGIASLVAFLREHGEAVEADLAFRAGPQDQLTKLGRGLTWRRLGILIDALARTPGTTLHRKLAGDDWTLDQHLLAIIADAARVANWQRSKSGRFASRRPKPISPFASRKDSKTVGNAGGRSPEQMAALLQAFKTGAFDAGR